MIVKTKLFNKKHLFLAKARPKELKDFPKWARCCSQYIEAAKSYGEMIVDLSDKDIACCKYCEAPRHCCFCGAGRPNGTIAVWVVEGISSGHYVPIELLEIDEGLQN